MKVRFPVAIYSMSVGNVSRAAGASSIASLSYILARPMMDERLQRRTPDYGRRERVEYCETLLPEGAREAWNDPERLFNSLELFEKAENARVAKKIMVALPRELDRSGQIELVRSFVGEQITGRGYAASFAIHVDRDNVNPHAHILIPNRQIEPKTGEWARWKSRKVYALDEHGERIALIDPATGEQKLGKRGERLWKRVSVQVNPLDEKKTLQALREAWAAAANRYLPEGVRIDHRSLEDQGVDRIPTVHEGYAAREIVRRGGVSELVERNKEISRVNALLAQLNQDLAQVVERIAHVHKTLKHGLRGIMSKIVELLPVDVTTADGKGAVPPPEPPPPPPVVIGTPPPPPEPVKIDWPEPEEIHQAKRAERQRELPASHIDWPEPPKRVHYHPEPSSQERKKTRGR